MEMRPVLIFNVLYIGAEPRFASATPSRVLFNSFTLYDYALNETNRLQLYTQCVSRVPVVPLITNNGVEYNESHVLELLRQDDPGAIFLLADAAYRGHSVAMSWVSKQKNKNSMWCVLTLRCCVF
jgi:hypothetical protein